MCPKYRLGGLPRAGRGPDCLAGVLGVRWREGRAEPPAPETKT